GLNGFDDLKSAAVGQAHVRQAQVELPGGNQGQTLPGVAGLGDLQPQVLESDGKQLPDIGFVVNDQCPAGFHGCPRKDSDAFPGAQNQSGKSRWSPRWGAGISRLRS